jgi:hypothetical protein
MERLGRNPNGEEKFKDPKLKNPNGGRIEIIRFGFWTLGFGFYLVLPGEREKKAIGWASDPRIQLEKHRRVWYDFAVCHTTIKQLRKNGRSGGRSLGLFTQMMAVVNRSSTASLNFHILPARVCTLGTLAVTQRWMS